MNQFEQEFQKSQITWRRRNITDTRWGRQNKKEYDWILPRDIQEENLYPLIRESLPVYLVEKEVKPHTGIHNLKSSWVLCANLYFIARDDEAFRNLLVTFLRDKIDSDISEIEKIELEYALDGDLHPSKLLGEKDGGRGFGQTSPDLALEVRLKNGGKGLLCIENKLVEHSFYSCSARTKKDRVVGEGKGKIVANPHPEWCLDIETVLKDVITNCHQFVWGRKYWEILEPVINRDEVVKLKRCPAATAGYQLFRQQALCEGIAQKGRFEKVWSCVAFDQRNDVLRHSLKSSGIDDFTVGWSGLFNGKAKFKTFTHQDWVSWVRAHEASQFRMWLKYVSERYGY